MTTQNWYDVMILVGWGISVCLVVGIMEGATRLWLMLRKPKKKNKVQLTNADISRYCL